MTDPRSVTVLFDSPVMLSHIRNPADKSWHRVGRVWWGQRSAFQSSYLLWPHDPHTSQYVIPGYFIVNGMSLRKFYYFLSNLHENMCSCIFLCFTIYELKVLTCCSTHCVFIEMVILKMFGRARNAFQLEDERFVPNVHVLFFCLKEHTFWRNLCLSWNLNFLYLKLWTFILKIRRHLLRRRFYRSDNKIC